MQGVEVMKVDEFKYLGVNYAKQWTKHKKDEEESAGRVEWNT